MKFSNSKLDIYKTCPKKFAIQYEEGWKVDITYSSLLFGRSMDAGINYLLAAKKADKELNLFQAKEIFYENMSSWKGNELAFYKNEIPEDLTEAEKSDPKVMQRKVWEHLGVLGCNMLDLYVKEILPKFKKVIDIQIDKKIVNADGDEFQIIADALIEYEDGRLLLIDNKTSSKKYASTTVRKSQQLSFYSEFFDNVKECAYVVLLKKPHPASGEMWHIVIDSIPEEMRTKAFDDLETSMQSIKNKDFPRNLKACYSFGRLCEFESYCKKGNCEGLIKKKGYK